MNILVVQESDWIKRNPHQQHHLMERLSIKGHEIRVIDYPIEFEGIYHKREVVTNYHKIHPDADIQVIRPNFFKLHALGYSTLWYYHRKEIYKQVKEFKPDVIIGFGILNTYIASRVAKKENIPFIYYWIDVLHTLIPEKRLQSLGKRLEKMIIKNSTKIITINKKLEDYVKNLGAVNTEVISAGIDLKKFDPTISGSKIRRKYSINDKDTVLFFMGFLYHFAGLKELAIELKDQHYENLKLLIVGDGEAFPDLQNIIKKYELEDQIILAGRKPYNEIPEFLAAADICILPADPNEEIMQDIVPIKLYEYMAMGKPVITSQLPGIKKEFGFNNGITYAKNPVDLVEIVRKLNIKLSGKQAREYVETNDWESIIKKFEYSLLELNG